LTAKYCDLKSSLFKIKKIPPTISLRFKAFRVSLISLYIALSVVESDLNPNCSSAKILYSNVLEVDYT
jgi:hypothetical protein